MLQAASGNESKYYCQKSKILQISKKPSSFWKDCFRSILIDLYWMKMRKYLIRAVWYYEQQRQYLKALCLLLNALETKGLKQIIWYQEASNFWKQRIHSSVKHLSLIELQKLFKNQGIIKRKELKQEIVQSIWNKYVEYQFNHPQDQSIRCKIHQLLGEQPQKFIKLLQYEIVQPAPDFLFLSKVHRKHYFITEESVIFQLFLKQFTEARRIVKYLKIQYKRQDNWFNLDSLEGIIDLTENKNLVLLENIMKQKRSKISFDMFFFLFDELQRSLKKQLAEAQMKIMPQELAEGKSQTGLVQLID